MSEKTFSKQVRALFKYRYVNTPETQNMYRLVQNLSADKWVRKEDLLSIISDYVLVNEEMMKTLMHISVLTHTTAKSQDMLMASWEHVMKELLSPEERKIVDNFDERIKKLYEEQHNTPG